MSDDNPQCKQGAAASAYRGSRVHMHCCPVCSGCDAHGTRMAQSDMVWCILVSSVAITFSRICHATRVRAPPPCRNPVRDVPHVAAADRPQPHRRVCVGTNSTPIPAPSPLPHPCSWVGWRQCRRLWHRHATGGPRLPGLLWVDESGVVYTAPRRLRGRHSRQPVPYGCACQPASSKGKTYDTAVVYSPNYSHNADACAGIV